LYLLDTFRVLQWRTGVPVSHLLVLENEIECRQQSDGCVSELSNCTWGLWYSW